VNNSPEPRKANLGVMPNSGVTLLASCAALMGVNSIPTRHPPVRMLPGGFGKASGDSKANGGKGKKGGGSASTAPVLDADAAALLERTGGDLDRAHTTFFAESVMRLQKEKPEVFAQIYTSAELPSSGEVHEKLVELTWDTIAAFMPLGGGTPGEVKRKLRLVSEAACSAPCRVSGDKAAVLDVGCGDGAALPFLCAAGADERRYVGLDLSSRMIRAAQVRPGP